MKYCQIVLTDSCKGVLKIKALRLASPTPTPTLGTVQQGVSGRQIREASLTPPHHPPYLLNLCLHNCLKHPPTHFHGEMELSSMKLGPGAKKVEDLCPKRRASLVAQLVKNLPAMKETVVPFLGWEDPLGKG